MILKTMACLGLVTASLACFAQSWKVISDETLGLRKITFTSPCGGMSIYLPGHIQAGDQISGTYFYEPSGNSDKEKVQASADMNGLVLEVAGTRLNPNERAFRFNALYQKVGFSITDPRENCSDQISLPIVSPTSFLAERKFLIPTVAKLGRPIVIQGEFDGNSTNTKCSMDDKPLEILAESPRQIVVLAPRATVGGHFIEVADRGKSTKASVLMEPNLSITNF